MLSGARSTGPGDQDHVTSSAIVLAHAAPFHIGHAEFSPPTREVVFEGRRSVIEPRVMQALVALHRADGAVVSKDDLVLSCWSGRIVGEDAINRVMSRLRGVAEKQAGGQFSIETITRVGYRLLPAAGSAHALSNPLPPDRSPKPRIGRRELIIGGGAVALAGVGGLGWVVRGDDAMPGDARVLVDNARKMLRGGDLDSPLNAIGTLRRATELAPRSAEVWGLLALAYTIAAVDSAAQDRPDLQARGAAAINRAFALEAHQPDALAAQIRTTPMYRNWFAYERACRSALRRHRDYPELVVPLAGMLSEVGRHREALQLCDKILPAMPLSPELLSSRAALLLSLGRIEEAGAAVDGAFDLLPRTLSIWNMKAFFLTFNGRPREALAMVNDVDGRPFGGSDDNYEFAAAMANAIASTDPKLRRETVEKLVHQAESGNGFVVAGATFAAFVGDIEQAFRLLNAFYFNRGLRLPDVYFNRAYSGFGGERRTGLLFGHAIAPIRRDPRFAMLTREIGLDDYWDRTNSRAQVIA